MSASDVFTVQELAVRWGVDAALVEELAELGVIQAEPAAGRVFSCEVTLRVGRFVRLQRDLGVNREGAAVILELLDRIEALERELRSSRRR
jgi:MerR family transcriptional regulator, heat shock protein HspR